MPERLELTKNAHIYIAKSEVTNEVIRSLLEEASSNMEPQKEFLISEFRQEGRYEEGDLTFNYVYSVRVFPTVRSVYFMNDGEVEDRIHAYIVIIEYDNHCAVLKKSCSNVSDLLKDKFTLIGSTELGRTFSVDAEYQKMSTRNMTVSDRAMRARSYEAANLKGLLSTHSAGRSIPYYLKVRQGTSIKSISGTGRIVESSQRISLDQVAGWVKEQVDLLENARDNEFLDAFAKKVELADVLNVTSPNALLIESSALSERIEKDNLVLVYRTRKSKLIKVSNRVKNKLLSHLEQTFEIDEAAGIMGFGSEAKIKINTQTLSLHSKLLSNFRVIENSKELTLQRYIVKNGLYSITFNEPRYMYFMGACFEDSSGISEITSILDILHPVGGMDRITSEKGTFTDGQEEFENDSIFHLVEEFHHGDDYVFCDDLGIEWADHITLNLSDGCISFIHSKHGSTTTSASKLHDVVGQGIKNLGNMFFSKQQLLDRTETTLNGYYQNSGVRTQIHRIRKGDVRALDNDLDNLLKNYQLHRKCILCCSFMSKSSIEAEFNKIRNHKPVAGHITQLLWIISSFLHLHMQLGICRQFQ
ncbi:hypothetical protein [Vibrio hyugaensis]|uniref:hypothetical protein n=1 Tax=Vibrio hyugaensis TaxID=1534743 RepID=UPI000B18CF5E|nr:hypothetical protein [Vibrio hyugaensis]